MDVSVAQSPTRVLKLTMPQRFDGKRKRVTEKLPVDGEKKRMKMEQQQVGEKISTRELPQELIIDEILTLLPIKSVVRFKSVSKSWLSLLSDSHFIKKHDIRNSMQNPNDYDCFVARKNVSGRDRRITIVSRSKESFALLKHGCSLIGSVNGLVCLFRDLKRVSLWNPAVHQSMQFNLPRDKQGGLIGVGFDPVTNDFKVVVCYPMLDSYAVYSSNYNSWIHLSLPVDHEFLMNKFEKSSFVPTTYVKDCPYWTYPTYSREEIPILHFPCYYYCAYGTYPSDDDNFIKTLVALKFDATSNKFKLLPKFFPDTQSCERDKIFKFVNMRDLFTLLAYKQFPTGMLDVHSLDEEKGCGVWIKMYDIDLFEQFTRQSPILQQGFKYSDEIVCFKNGEICYYDHKKRTFKSLPGMKAFGLFNCFTYTPNMIFLRGMKSIYEDDQARPLDHPMRLLNSLKK